MKSWCSSQSLLFCIAAGVAVTAIADYAHAITLWKGEIKDEVTLVPGTQYPATLSTDIEIWRSTAHSSCDGPAHNVPTYV